jgi:hypothetical protein
VDNADRKGDLFVSIEDGLGPILAIGVAAVLGFAVLHFDHNVPINPTAKTEHSRSHVARG